MSQVNRFAMNNFIGRQTRFEYFDPLPRICSPKWNEIKALPLIKIEINIKIWIRQYDFVEAYVQWRTRIWSGEGGGRVGFIQKKKQD